MNINVSLFILFLISIIIFRLVKGLNDANKYPLRYFIAHIMCNFLMMFLGVIYLLEFLPFPIAVNALIKYLGLILLALYSESIFNNRKAKLSKLFSFLFIVNVFIFVCNHLGHRFLAPKTDKIVMFFFNKGILLSSYRDFSVFFVLTTFITIVLILKRFLDNCKNLEVQNKKQTVFKNYFIFYCGLIMFNLFAVAILKIFLQEFTYKNSLITMINLCYWFELLFLIVMQKKLNSIIKLNFWVEDNVSGNPKKDQIHNLSRLLISKKLFLEPDFSLNKMVYHSRLSVLEIRSTLKNSEHKNFKTFLNHHRVNHATKLIDEGYLYKNSLYSLSLAAGFNSSQTFFRVFKDIQKKSPTKYSLEKNEA